MDTPNSKEKAKQSKQSPNQSLGSISQVETRQIAHRRILESLRGRIFVGKYTEKRYVESLEDYRDIIVVDSGEDVTQYLSTAQKIFAGLSKDKWVGITNDPDNDDSVDTFLWVRLNNLPLGKHWFQIVSVVFEAKEIFLIISHVQPFRAPERSIISSSDIELPPLDLKEILTFQNFCKSVKFLAVLLMTIITIAIEIMRYLGEYTLKLSNIFVNLVHVSTPICLGIFDFLSRCVGGLYWLVFVLIKGSPNNSVMPAALMGNPNQRLNTSFKPLEYRKLDSPQPPQRYSGTPQSFNTSFRTRGEMGQMRKF